ncbi:MAG TPA: selenium-binding family protein [Ktedonobacterales bacterium]
MDHSQQSESQHAHTDPTFYPSPRLAMDAPREQLAYVVTLNPTGDGRPDALCVVDVDAGSPTYGQVVGRLDMPYPGDELHHFGWNACSSCLCHTGAHAGHMERRYLLVPGLRSSRINILDTKPDPRQPQLVKVIPAEELASRAGYSRPHTVHCGPDAIYISALGAPNGEGPGGILMLDPEDFSVRGPWESARDSQYLAYDFWWHLGHDILLSSEWGTPNMIEAGLNPDLLLAGKYGHALHVWDLRDGRHLQTLELGAEQQMVLELRPSHDPTQTYGFVNTVVSLADLSSSIWVWHHDNGAWRAQKVIEIPAEPADAEVLPPALKPFGAVPPLVTDIDLSLDDRSLYVSCWGTGEFRQYDVSDPFHPQLTGVVRLGGIASHAPHPRSGELNGGPQMVEVSRDGRRVYVSNSLYASWDAQFYPEGIRGWIAKLDADPAGGLTLDSDFFVTFEGERPHQIRLQGGDASSDSFCFPSQ